MSKPGLLEIQNLSVEVQGTRVLNDFNLNIGHGEVHALMGRNGSGKTTLAHTLMGHHRYTVTSGKILLNGENITDLSPEERAKKRLFLGFQYPVALPGVSVANFLRTSIKAVRSSEVPSKNVRALIETELKRLDIPDSFMSRSINEGFSGGEKKKLETLQLRLLQPVIAVLDETDSGLDIDALRLISETIAEMRAETRSFLLITHYQRLLKHLSPDFVHVMHAGKIVKSGGAELARQLEEKGYESIIQEAAA